MHRLSLISAILMATTCYAVAIQPAVSEEKSYAQSEISMGNGESNWIITEGMIRDGASFTFPEVKIKGNGWLVMHPFTDGKPDGKIYVGHTYILDGINSDVDISVEPTPSSGDMFIVMLHRDVDEDREFDFVFVDENHVEDRAVFEGSTMIAHVIAAP